MEETREYYFLNRIEFNILLAAAGIENWYGPFKDGYDGSINSQDDLNRVIAELYRKEILDWENEVAVASKNVSRILQIIGNSSRCILKIRADDIGGISYLYPAGEVAAEVSVSRNDTNALRVSLVRIDDWINSLADEEFFPGGFGDVPEILPDVPDEEYSALEIHDTRTGNLIHKLTSEDKGVYSILFYENKAYVCEQEICEAIIKSWLKENNE